VTILLTTKASQDISHTGGAGLEIRLGTAPQPLPNHRIRLQ